MIFFLSISIRHVIYNLEELQLENEYLLKRDLIISIVIDDESNVSYSRAKD